MGFGLQRDPRARFILRHGVVPWGIVAGVVAAVGGGLGARAGSVSIEPVSRATELGIAALCFVIWCFVAGWVVGAIRWELRESERTKPRSRPRGGG